MHRRCMVRMAGLPYGVLPFKQIYLAVLSLTWLPGGALLLQLEGGGCPMLTGTALPVGKGWRCCCVSTGMRNAA